MLLFSYGSNGIQQLADRLGHPVEALPAYLPEHGRVFRGWSQGWGGGVASILWDPDRTVFGNVTRVSGADLKVLDSYEGANMSPPRYRRKRFKVQVDEGNGFEEKKAIAYVSTSKEFNAPSREYVAAVQRNLQGFWQGDMTIDIA